MRQARRLPPRPRAVAKNNRPVSERGTRTRADARGQTSLTVVSLNEKFSEYFGDLKVCYRGEKNHLPNI